MEHDHRHAVLVAWLEEQGYQDSEIQRVLNRLADYDEQTLHESVFDSIDGGTIDLAAIVKEVLSQTEGNREE